MALPGSDNDLETLYSAGEIVDVATKDAEYVGQTAIGQYAIHQYKDFAGNAVSFSVEWEGKTNNSTTAVFLQIYNRSTEEWETMDSNLTPPVDTNFVLTGNIANSANYKDASNVVSCRVYQLDE